MRPARPTASMPAAPPRSTAARCRCSPHPATTGNSTTYTILRATGGVSGAYAGVSSNFAFLTPSLSYDANDVFLTLSLGQTAFTPSFVALTPNQKAVGVALNQSIAAASGDFATVIGALAGLSTAQGPLALDTISGQPYADFGTMNTNSSMMFMNAIGQQMANARGASSRRPAPGAGASLRDRELRCRRPVERVGQCAGRVRQRAGRYQCLAPSPTTSAAPRPASTIASIRASCSASASATPTAPSG